MLPFIFFILWLLSYNFEHDYSWFCFRVLFAIAMLSAENPEWLTFLVASRREVAVLVHAVAVIMAFIGDG